MIAVIVVLTTVNAQMPGLGPCPDIAGVKDINVWKLVGVWYQIERYLSIVEAFTSCTTATYGSNTTVTGGSTNFPLTYQQKAA